ARRELELVLDPTFFAALARRLEAAAEVEPKRGWAHNELTRFRYDVVLKAREAPVRGAVEPARLAWDNVGGLDALKVWLARGQDALLVSGVPSARPMAEVKALDLLARADGPATAGELRRAAAWTK